MGILLLRLAGPLQSWGSSSRFVHRNTEREPTKSAIVGLLASAQGRLRGDDIEDLLDMRFGVRIDQPGVLINDMQTERPARGEAMPLTYRYYLSDAKFLVGLEASETVLEGLDESLKHPRWPLYLGRRACPPEYPVSLGIQPFDSLEEALSQYSWIAATWYKQEHRGRQLEVVCDVDASSVDNLPTSQGVVSSQADIPLSFGASRKYAVRTVSRYRIPNPDGGEASGNSRDLSTTDHDPMSFF